MAFGPHSLRFADKVADGVRLLGFCSRRYVEEEIIPRPREGMARSGQTREHFEITGGGFVATGRDAEATATSFGIVRG